MFSIIFILFCVLAVMAQKTDDLPPLELPQTPAVPRAGSDARDEHLKGKVKHILEEAVYLPDSDGSKGKPRHKNSEFFYNERGDLVKTQYFTGIPQTIVYGFIDGARVSLSRDDPGSEGLIAITGEPENLEEKPKAKPDPRYEYKYTYTYDNNGRLIEEIMFDNRGEMWRRSTYSYPRDNTVERLSYLKDSKNLEQKEIMTLDEKGNVISNAQTEFQPKKTTDLRESKYLEYDKQGNWTKMALKVKTHKYDGSPIEYNYINYRTIEYYP